MAIQWAGDGTLRVGIDVWTDAYDTWTPSINVYVALYVGSDNYNYADNQTMHLRGSVSADYAFRNDLPRAPGATKHVATYTVGGQGQSYGGGPQYTFQASISGNDVNGANPVCTVYFTLPPKPIRAPSAPGAPTYSNVNAKHADIGWGLPGDQGGSSVDYTWLQIGLQNFASLVYDNQTPGWVGRSLDIFAPNTIYYARAAAHNAAGWSGWSGVSSFQTPAYAVPTPTLSNVNPDSVTVNWTAPPDSAAPTSYELQYATDPGFTSPQTLSGGWATSRQVTGLTPATTYYYRVRANPGTGWGAWSPAASSQTLSGAKVRQGGAWVNGVAYARVAGAWQLVKVWKRVNGSWVL